MFWKRLAVLIAATCALASEEAFREGVAKINSGDYAGAYDILYAEWQSCKRELGVNAPNTLKVQIHLGQSLTMMGRPHESLDLLVPAVRELTAIAGADSHDGVVANAMLAIAMREAGNYAEAEKLLARSAAHSSLPPLDQSNLTAQHALALALLNHKKEALRAAKRAVEIAMNGGLENTQHHTHLLVTLGQIELVSGKLNAASATLRQAEAAGLKLLPENHPEWATLYSGLGIVCQYEGKRREGEQYFRRALTLAQAVLGPDHQEVAIIMRHLAAALGADRKKEANELNTRSTAIFRRASQDPVSVWSLKAKE